VVEVVPEISGISESESTGSSAPDGLAEHERGLLLMRALVDRVGFQLLPGVGSVVALEKRLSYADGEPAGHGQGG
jgi:anti-sigma regulatory factor (Ser/Thr protein kinase)